MGAVVLGLVLLAMLAAACGGGTDESTTTTAGGATTTTAGGAVTTTTPAAPTEFTVLVSNPALYPFYELYIGVAKGFFEKRNLKVTIQVVDGTPGIITGFAANQGQIVYGDLGSFLRPTASSQFTPVAFYMNNNVGVFDIIVPDSSPVKTAADLNGKVIGANSEDDPGVALIRNLDRSLGITNEILYTGDHLQALAAFDRGEIAAYAGSLPDLAVLQARGVKLRSVAPTDIRTASGGSGFWSKRETMNANPEAFKAFVAAIQDTQKWVDWNPQKIVDWVNSVDPIPADEMAYNLALATALMGLRAKEVTPLGYIDPAVWQKWWDDMVANQVINPSMGAPTDFYTNEFQSQ
jgi:NitT/TauT family transport system substrate-binding protein